jgi:hypothetical protein
MTIRVNSLEPQRHIADMIADGRRAAGYTYEELAIASGLTVSEIRAIELGADMDENRVRRVAVVLRLPGIL